MSYTKHVLLIISLITIYSSAIKAENLILQFPPLFGNVYSENQLALVISECIPDYVSADQVFPVIITLSGESGRRTVSGLTVAIVNNHSIKKKETILDRLIGCLNYKLSLDPPLNSNDIDTNHFIPGMLSSSEAEEYDESNYVSLSEVEIPGTSSTSELPTGSSESPTGSSETPTGSSELPTGSSEPSSESPIGSSEHSSEPSSELPIGSSESPTNSSEHSSESPTGSSEQPTGSSDSNSTMDSESPTGSSDSNSTMDSESPTGSSEQPIGSSDSNSTMDSESPTGSSDSNSTMDSESPTGSSDSNSTMDSGSPTGSSDSEQPTGSSDSNSTMDSGSPTGSSDSEPPTSSSDSNFTMDSSEEGSKRSIVGQEEEEEEEKEEVVPSLQESLKEEEVAPNRYKRGTFQYDDILYYVVYYFPAFCDSPINTTPKLIGALRRALNISAGHTLIDFYTTSNATYHRNLTANYTGGHTVSLPPKNILVDQVTPEELPLYINETYIQRYLAINYPNSGACVTPGSIDIEFEQYRGFPTQTPTPSISITPTISPTISISPAILVPSAFANSSGNNSYLETPFPCKHVEILTFEAAKVLSREGCDITRNNPRYSATTYTSLRACAGQSDPRCYGTVYFGYECNCAIKSFCQPFQFEVASVQYRCGEEKRARITCSGTQPEEVGLKKRFHH